MGSGDQRGAVVGAGDGARVAATGERDLEHFEVVVDCGDGDDVVALGVERVGIGAKPDERARRPVLPAESCDVQRRAAVGVLDIRLLAFGDELFDLGDIAARGGVMQTGIDAQFPLGRWRLREHDTGCAGAPHREKTENNETNKVPRHGCTDAEICPR